MSIIREDAHDVPVSTGGDAAGNSSDTSSDNILLVGSAQIAQTQNSMLTLEY